MDAGSGSDLGRRRTLTIKQLRAAPPASLRVAFAKSSDDSDSLERGKDTLDFEDSGRKQPTAGLSTSEREERSPVDRDGPGRMESMKNPPLATVRKLAILGQYYLPQE